MKIYRAMLPIEGSGSIFECDVIEYQSKFWLVPEWLESLELGLKRPTRIVLLDLLPHQRSQGAKWDFVVNIPISKDVLDGRAPPPPKSIYVVIEEPDVKIRIGPPAAPGSESTH